MSAPTQVLGGIVAFEELDLDDLTASSSSADRSLPSSYLPSLTPLNEDLACNKRPLLQNVDDLETSLGKVASAVRAIASAKVTCSSLDDSRGKRAMLLRKSKPPIAINSSTSIEQEYHIDYCKELGRGTNTIVRKAVERSTGKRYAVKSVKKTDRQETEHMRKEIDLLSDLDHVSIVELHAAYEDEAYLHMVMEICKGGELHKYMADRVKKVKTKEGKTEHKSVVDERAAAAIVCKVVDAVAYLHEHNIVHRDLKLENIMFLSKDKKSKKADTTAMDIRLVDFGLSKRYDTHRSFGSLNKLSSFVGTNYYIAPEVLDSLGYTHSCDLWSVGVLAYALLSSKPPFYGKDNGEIFDKIKQCDEVGVQFPSRDWEGVSEEAKDFIQQLLVKDERRRPCAVELREHPWIKNALKENDQMRANKTSAKCSKAGFLKKKLFGFGKKSSPLLSQ